MNIYGYNIELEKKNIKNINMYIRSDGSIKITAPHRVKDKEIEAFVFAHLDWLEKNTKRVAEKSEKHSPKRLLSDGDTLCLWGKGYTVKTMLKKRFSIEIEGETATVTYRENSTDEQRIKHLTEWYRAQLEIEAQVYFSKWESVTGLSCSSFQIRDMKTRWGSCNTKTKRILLSLRLACLDKSCLDYVVLHELVHTLIPNHGAEFKAELTKYMPEWRTIQKEMKH